MSIVHGLEIRTQDAAARLHLHGVANRRVEGGGWRPVNRNIGGSSRLSKDTSEELPSGPVVLNKVDHTYIMKIL